MKERVCKQEVLVSAPDGIIHRCDCGVYHVEIDGVTLHLESVQFKAVARLFKLALGMLAARSPMNERTEGQFYFKKQVMNGGIR